MGTAGKYDIATFLDFWHTIYAFTFYNGQEHLRLFQWLVRFDVFMLYLFFYFQFMSAINPKISHCNFKIEPCII